MTVTDTSFQMANLVQEVVDGMQQALLPTDADENEAEEFLHKANVAADASMQQTVLMQQMLQMMQAMKHQMNIAPTSSDATARNCSFPTRTRTTIDKYCWSHVIRSPGFGHTTRHLLICISIILSKIRGFGLEVTIINVR